MGKDLTIYVDSNAFPGALVKGADRIDPAYRFAPASRTVVTIFRFGPDPIAFHRSLIARARL